MDLRWFSGESSVSPWTWLSCPVPVLFSLSPGLIQHSLPHKKFFSNHWSWAALTLAKVRNVGEFEKFPWDQQWELRRVIFWKGPRPLGQWGRGCCGRFLWDAGRCSLLDQGSEIQDFNSYKKNKCWPYHSYSSFQTPCLVKIPVFCFLGVTDNWSNVILHASWLG